MKGVNPVTTIFLFLAIAIYGLFQFISYNYGPFWITFFSMSYLFNLSLSSDKKYMLSSSTTKAPPELFPKLIFPDGDLTTCWYNPSFFA